MRRRTSRLRSRRRRSRWASTSCSVSNNLLITAGRWRVSNPMPRPSPLLCGNNAFCQTSPSPACSNASDRTSGIMSARNAWLVSVLRPNSFASTTSTARYGGNAIGSRCRAPPTESSTSDIQLPESASETTFPLWNKNTSLRYPWRHSVHFLSCASSPGEAGTLGGHIRMPRIVSPARCAAPLSRHTVYGGIHVHVGTSKDDTAAPATPPPSGWADVPALPDEVRFLLQAQVEAAKDLPYRLPGARRPSLDIVYVRQDLGSGVDEPLSEHQRPASILDSRGQLVDAPSRPVMRVAVRPPARTVRKALDENDCCSSPVVPARASQPCRCGWPRWWPVVALRGSRSRDGLAGLTGRPAAVAGTRAGDTAGPAVPGGAREEPGRRVPPAGGFPTDHADRPGTGRGLPMVAAGGRPRRERWRCRPGSPGQHAHWVGIAGRLACRFVLAHWARRAAVEVLAFEADGRLVTGSRDGTARL